MRLLFVVQRYGPEVAGGAEKLCREFAIRMGRRGHHIEVLSTCALDYSTWANVFEPGISKDESVTVHRLPVDQPRDPNFFTPLYMRVIFGRKPVPLYLQREWLRIQGPYVSRLEPWLEEESRRFDLVVFFTYLYYTTTQGLSAVHDRPTVLHPTAHDEPPLHLQIFEQIFRMPSALAFSTPEEADLVSRRFRSRQLASVIGIGVELPSETDPATFRQQFDLGERDYLLFLGRVEPHKGSEELVEFFNVYKDRHPGPLSLVIMGETVAPVKPSPDVVVTGFVEEDMKKSALEGCLALVNPSYFESFSMVVTEAWARKKPVLVQGSCAVLDGQVRRAGGGIPYQGFAEFESAVELVVKDKPLCRALGEAGHAYVRDHYSWERVLGDYEALLEVASREGPLDHGSDGATRQTVGA